MLGAAEERGRRSGQQNKEEMMEGSYISERDADDILRRD